MSVYTQLTNEQFTQFCAKFGLIFKKATPITQGIKNSNWFIETTDDTDSNPSYVFTLFEERKPHEIVKMASILNALKDTLPVACPLKANNGDFVLHYDNKAILILPKLTGKHPSDELGGITLTMCEQMGQALAKLHLSLQTLTPAEHYGVELYPWHLVKERETKFMPSDEAKLMNDIWNAYDNLPKDLPKGLCHLDMFADNTLWDFSDKPTLTGLLDFTEVSIEYFVMDLAITINDFCTSWGNAENGETVEFDNQKMTALINGYNEIRPLSDDENKALPIMLAYSATIFWLLRLNVIYYNREQGRTGENIMVKNPDLMKRLASLHWTEKVVYQSPKFWNDPYTHLTVLKARGLIVSDETRAINYLNMLGCYRLGGYFYPFRISKNNQKTTNFMIGTNFDDVLQLYLFDKGLRSLAFDALERIEMSIRVDIATILSKKSPTAHTNPQYFDKEFVKKINPKTQKTGYDVWIERYNELIKQRQRKLDKKDDFVSHNLNKYGYLPIWIACEILDFGALSRLYSGLKPKDREIIAKKYQTNERNLSQWLRSLNFIRNVVAHHGRLWNLNVVDRSNFNKYFQNNSEKSLENNKAFGYFYIMGYLLNIISPHSTWQNRLLEHIHNHFPKVSNRAISLDDFGYNKAIDTLWNNQSTQIS